MGYCADYSGSICFKADAPKKICEDFLDTLKSLSSCNDEGSVDFGELFLFGRDECYHGEDWGEALKPISPYVTEGYVEFIGDDYDFWRYRFNPDDQTWTHENGRTVYIDDDDLAVIRKALICYAADGSTDKKLEAEKAAKGLGVTSDEE